MNPTHELNNGLSYLSFALPGTGPALPSMTEAGLQFEPALKSSSAVYLTCIACHLALQFFFQFEFYILVSGLTRPIVWHMFMFATLNSSQLPASVMTQD